MQSLCVPASGDLYPVSTALGSDTGAFASNSGFGSQAGNNVSVMAVERECPRYHNSGLPDLYSWVGGSTRNILHSSSMLRIMGAIAPKAYHFCWGAADSGDSILYPIVRESIITSAGRPLVVVNYSLGVDGGDGKYNIAATSVDSFSDSGNFLPVVAAGNNGVNKEITSPGTSLNALTVGAYNATTKYVWAEARPPFLGSHGIRPSQGHMNKPEIVSPGSNLEAPGLGGTGCGGMTSGSTAYASGVITSYISNNAWLVSRPWLTKAIVLAGATQEVKNKTWQEWRAKGTGGIRYYTMQNTRGADVRKTNFTKYDGQGRPYFEKEYYAQQGEYLRAAVAWWTDGVEPYARAQNGNYNITDVRYRLELFAPGYRHIAGAHVASDPYAVVGVNGGVRAPSSGNYILRVTRVREAQGNDEGKVGIAFNRKGDLRDNGWGC